MISRRSLLTGLKPFTLSMIDIAEVSMLTFDNTSGTQSIQLKALDSLGNNVSNYVSWSSSSNAVSVINGLCIATEYAGASGTTAIITATKNGVSRTCLVTAFSTVPDNSSLLGLKGGKGPNLGGSSGYYIDFSTSYSPLDCARLYGDLNHVGEPSGETLVINIKSGGTFGVSIRRKYVTSTTIKIQSFYSSDGINYTDDQQYFETTGIGIFDIGARVSSGIYRDEILLPSTSQNGSMPAWNYSLFRFPNSAKKITRISLDVGKTQSDLLGECLRVYRYQDYVRYTDTGSYVNRTVIPNRGTLGSTYNLEANSVPSSWFGV